MTFRSYSLTLLLLVAITSCNRNTAKDNAKKDIELEQPAIKDSSSITVEDPFHSQPNEFCTVIRKLDASVYLPGQNIEDASLYPKKYCLLDACLETVTPNDPIVDLGDGTEPVTTACKLIRVFDSYEEAKAYVDKYKIVDYQFDE